MKKVSFGAKPNSEPSPQANIDKWVEDRSSGSPEPIKRLTIDVPISLHKRIKSQCAIEEIHMADEIRKLLEQRFPKRDEGTS